MNYRVEGIDFLILSIIAVFTGSFVNRTIPLLKRNNIPEAVTGGLLFSLAIAIASRQWELSIEFDMRFRDILLLVFFTTVGLTAKFRLLLAGGRALAILLAIAMLFLFLQNATGVLIATSFGGDPAYGLFVGSISLAGGHGTAGLGAYRAAKEHTDSVVLIEGGPYGTTCARVGCMPSKLLIAAAEAAHSIEKSSIFGVSSGSVVIDGKAVLQRVRAERDRFAGFVVESVEGIPVDERIRGYAEFVDDHLLRVMLEEGGEMELSAARIVIATGSRPSYPATFDSLGDRLLVNDSVFELETLPESIAVFSSASLSTLGVRPVAAKT